MAVDLSLQRWGINVGEKHQQWRRMAFGSDGVGSNSGTRKIVGAKHQQWLQYTLLETAGFFVLCGTLVCYGSGCVN